MILLASNASKGDKLQDLFQHILLSANGESLKTAFSAYVLQDKSSSDGKKKILQPKKKPNVQAELKDLPAPKDGESNVKLI